MTKLLMWLALAFLVLYVLRNKKKAARKSDDQSARPFARSSQAANPAEPETMLRCAQCGVHLPESEAVRSPSGTVFCSDEHRLLSGAR